MGSSKKHKDKDREHKKKRKHRSRSKSRERESKRRHREREEYESADYPVYEDYGQPPDREEGEIDEQYSSRAYKQEHLGDREVESSGGADLTLSIQETNKLRAKLGLKPLEVSTGSGDKPEKESLKDDIHRPAENWGDKRKQDKVKEKLERSKQKRQVAEKLGKIKTLGESDSDEDAATWVRKNRMKQRERDRAEKTAKMLEEMDAEFGIGNLVEEEFKDANRKPNYTSRDLKGLKVDHDVSRFKEGQSVILTLKDRGVLDEDEDGETLINMNMQDLERAEKNVELRKGKPDYNPYDEGDVDEYGMFKVKDVLSKYDEEIDGEKRKNFKLGRGGAYDDTEDRQMERITQELRAQAQTLSTNINIASEYMTAEEVQAKFKKVKKKVRKIRKKKMLKADDLLPLADESEGQDFGSRHGRMRQEGANIPGLDVEPDLQSVIKQEPLSDDDRAMMMDDNDDDDDVEDLTGVKLEEDQADLDLQVALDKARKLKQKKDRKNPEKIAERIKTEQSEADMDDKDNNITLNATSEFCRALGEIPTYGQSGNRDEIEKDELMELERELLEERRKMEEEEDEPTGWNRVEIDETPVNITGEEAAILEEEPVIAQGMFGALAVAMNKGFLEHEKIKAHRPIKNKEDLEAQNYSIEDKRYDDLDEKYKKRDRYSGALMDFKEKDSYKPDFKLQYVDETGRHLNAKEAFRQLSHRFHGKGSGKRKTEKRTKKLDEEHLMEKMNSTDTPLNTVALLKEKQTQEKTPYIVLSGNKGFTNTMVKSTT